ncbi:unnamed protein product [Rotaria sordida]|uniref:F-box domain-containing protein n=1 Tax=Rotaria sordida TaxID=392033 RepID=A0A814SMI5_9BILA|nr:unnamed protein product [Rotaria sordida]CAF1156765.1 unnamed protein product [Rotaria sordida]
MKYSFVQFNDLPDEILLIIFKKLDNAELLYSLIDVNKRLNKILCDSIFTSRLTLMTHLLNNSISPFSDSLLGRFCLQILPKIYDKIEWLNLESSSMERILLSTNYPNLYGLGLYNMEVERAKYLFTDETSLTNLFKNQISSLIIDINECEKQISTPNVNTLLFTHIFTMFINLQYLNFNPSLFSYQHLSFNFSPPTVCSSSLLELHICLQSFSDCLYLLDGCFNQLRTFYVNICYILSSSLRINNKEKLPNLRCFSLRCDNVTNVYDELIVPFLHRMLNLEKLDLHLVVDLNKGFIDGNELKTIINHMPQLNKFIFNICSTIRLPNETELRSNEDVQNTFKDFKDDQIISCVDYFQKSKYSQCHIYSYPYKITHYRNITNNFPGGLFKCVRTVELFDERPFEHEFFLRIQKSFPFMKELTIINRKPQKNKQYTKFTDDNRDLSIIEYSHLIELNLIKAHRDYVEQFLVDTKMCLPNNVSLYVDYFTLKKVTHNFKRDATRINCAKMNYLCTTKVSRYSKHLYDYFLYAETDGL